MKKEVKQVKFDNRKNPQLKFDMLRLEDLLKRAGMDHSPMQLHRVNFFMLILITDGEGFHSIDFQDYPYQKHSIFTVRKDQIHRFHHSNSSGVLLLFTEDFVVSYLERQEAIKTLQLFNELLGSPTFQLGAEEFEEILRLVQEIQVEYGQYQDEYAVSIIRSLLQAIISRIYRAKAKNKNFIPHSRYLESFMQLQNLVEEQCFQTKRVRDYADQMRVTTKTLNNIVQHVIKKTAKTFIDEVVIMQIKRLLINSPLSIKEIAYQAGFQEPTNLYKYFKRYTQTSPEVFRKLYQ